MNIEQLKDIAYEEIVSTHFEEMKEILEKRLLGEKNPYQEIMENENFGFEDGQQNAEDSSENEDEDSFELGD